MPFRINHIHIKAADPRKAAEWWVSAFRFKILSDQTRPFGDRFIRCEAEGGTLVTISNARTGETLAPGQGPFYVNTDKRPWLPVADHPRRAAVSAFGFGGSNFHAVLEEHRSEKAGPDWDGRVQIIALSASTATELAQRLDRLPAKGSWNELCQAAAAT